MMYIFYTAGMCLALMASLMLFGKADMSLCEIASAAIVGAVVGAVALYLFTRNK